MKNLERNGMVRSGCDTMTFDDCVHRVAHMCEHPREIFIARGKHRFHKCISPCDKYETTATE